MTDNTSFQEITTIPTTAAATVITVSSNSSSFSSVMASTRKRNNEDNDDNNDVGGTVTVNVSSKRPKVSTIVDHAVAIDVDAAAVDDDTDAKTNVVVTPTMTTTTTDATTAITTTTATTTKEEVETIVDIAESLRLKAGDRIEVQWEIHNDKDKDNSNNNNNNGKKEEEEIGAVAAAAAAATKDDGNSHEKNNTTSTNNDDDDDEKEKDDGDSNDDDETNNDNVVVTLHWWKATLLEHDGRTLDSVAIRSLLYDGRPDLGFPEPSLEDVIFMGHDVLINSEDVLNDEGSDDPDALIAVSRRMPFRRCGDINNEGEGEGYVARVRGENEIIFTNDDELEDILHTVLMGNFQKHQDKWKHLSAAQHAIIASTMKKKKDKLFTLIKEEVKHNKIITADSIKEMMTKI